MGAARRARLPQLRRQALLHPVRIDDAGPAHRRPARGHQISLRLVLGVARASTSSRTGRAGCSASCPSAATSSSSPRRAPATDYIKRVIGLPGDSVEMVDGTLDHQRPGGEAPSRGAPTMVPVDANSPCGTEHVPALYDYRVAARRKVLLPAADRPRTLPSGRPTTLRARPIARGQFRTGHGPARPPLADGRQPRPIQRRQPLRLEPQERPRRSGAVGEYRRPRRVHHLLARRHARSGTTR